MTSIDLLDDPDAIVGASGAGKSYTGRAKVEQLLGHHRHTIIFDPTGVWYGLRSDAAGTEPGIDIPIFGGPHGDVPITPAIGGRIADLLLGERISAVIDLSTFEEEDLRGFALDFLDRLRTRERVNLHLVFDEAEEFAPQTPPDDVAFRLVGRMNWIAKRGRVYGLVPTFITQRPADFAKKVLSQVQTFYFHQLIAPNDQKPVVDYLKANADKETLDRVKASLPGLERGQRWIYSPRRQLLELGTTAPIATFDSMATPPPGESKREPRTLAQLDVSKIREALAPPVSDPSIATDPIEAYHVGAAAGELLLDRDRRIADLEEAVLQAEQGKALAVEILLFAMERIDEAANAISGKMQTHLDRLQESLADTGSPPDPTGGGAAGGGELAPPAPPAANHAELPELNGIAVSILTNLERIAPAKLTWAQAAQMAGRSPKSGPFYAAKKQLLASGKVKTDGELVAAASRGKGIDRSIALGIWRSVFVGGFAPRMLDVLADGQMRHRDALGTAMGVSTKSGPWFGGLKQLRERKLIDEYGAELRLANPLPGES